MRILHRAPDVGLVSFSRYEDVYTGGSYRAFKNENAITYPKTISFTPNVDEQYKLKFVGNHLGGSLNVGHYHCYIRKELEDSDIFYKAEDDKKIETVSDKEVKRHLPSAYTFVYLKQQLTVKEDKNIVVTVEDTVEDTLSEEEMGKPIVISDDDQGSEKARDEIFKEPSDNAKVIHPDCVKSCDDLMMISW